MAKESNKSIKNPIVSVASDAQEATDKLNNLVKVIIPLTGVFMALQSSMSMNEVIASFDAALGLAKEVSEIIQIVSNALDVMTTSQINLNFAMLLSNPIPIIVGLIAGLIASIIYLWTTNEDFRNAIIDIFNNVKDVISEVFNAIGNFFIETIPSWISMAINWFKELPYNVGYLIGVVLGYIIKFGIDITSWITTELPKIINSVINWFRELPENILNLLLKTIDNIELWIINMKNMIMENIPLIIENISNFFNDLPANMLNIGKNIVEGLWNGINNAAAWLKDKIASFAKGILDGMKSVLGIHSPSKEFRDEVGKYIALGIGEGFIKNIKYVYADMQKTIDIETGKLSANLTSTATMQVENEDKTQATLQAISDNKEIIINSTVELDGEKVAKNTNRVNKKLELQYGF